MKSMEVKYMTFLIIMNNLKYSKTKAKKFKFKASKSNLCSLKRRF